MELMKEGVYQKELMPMSWLLLWRLLGIYSGLLEAEASLLQPCGGWVQRCEGAPSSTPKTRSLSRDRPPQ